MVRRFLKKLVNGLGLQRTYHSPESAVIIAKKALASRHPGATVSYTVLKKEDFSEYKVRLTFEKQPDTTVELVEETIL